MYYCFVKEDLNEISKSDPLYIQVRYAERLGKCVYCSLNDRRLFDKNGTEVFIDNDTVFLRATCDSTQKAIDIITSKSGIVMETLDDIDLIEKWANYVDVQRDLFYVSFYELISDKKHLNIFNLLNNNELVFVKSSIKGFSAVVATEKIKNKDEQVISFLQKKCKELDSDILIVSDYCQIKKDSIGKKEARFWVLENEIINCSRMVHSVRHTVPKKLVVKAQEIVNALKNNQTFPNNYVLDVAEFCNENGSFVDVVELNPITNAMCYVNNSIFKIQVDEIKAVSEKFSGGFEYCYDFLYDRSNYVLERCAGENFEYISDEHWFFI